MEGKFINLHGNVRIFLVETFDSAFTFGEAGVNNFCFQFVTTI